MRKIVVICILVVVGTGIATLREGPLALTAPVLAALIAELLQRDSERFVAPRIILNLLMTFGAAAMNLNRPLWGGKIALFILMLVCIAALGSLEIASRALRRAG